MKYYIYENWTAEKKAVIHKENCSYCNSGNGIHPEKTNKNGTWHGPFENWNDAWCFASSLKGREVRCCKTCNPDKENS